VGASGVALFGAFLTWTRAGDVTLDGIRGPNNWLLVVIVALFAMGWARPLARGSSIGAIGVSGPWLRIAGIESWTDNRAVLDAGAGIGLPLVVGAAIMLAAMPVAVVGARALRIP
jgi:hypothetical protein